MNADRTPGTVKLLRSPGKAGGFPIGLKRIIKNIEKDVLELAQAKHPCCKVFSFGAVDINPKHLAIWVTTDTDQQRDSLQANPEINEEIKEITKANHYPKEAIPFVGVAFESEETVKRDFEGNWWYAVK